ncbi:MAG: RlmE family RNA methyltransferase [Proteobacteria bacterium]|nr:RlmE family RNA methyltransferase [Pseudomonadota bacterium]
MATPAKRASPLNPTGKKHRFGKAWMHEHVTDHWVNEARRLGYRSRAAFKLIEILERDHLLKPGMRVVDLGAAPGSWSQVLAQRLGGKGRVFAVDLLDFEPIRNVTALKADFASDEGLATVEAALDGVDVDLVVSDMAPNLSGIEPVDQARGVHLAELALEFAIGWLKPGGDFAVKMFQGEGFDAFKRQVEGHFAKAYVRKPKASRDRSREVFVVGKGLEAAARDAAG